MVMGANWWIRYGVLRLRMKMGVLNKMGGVSGRLRSERVGVSKMGVACRDMGLKSGVMVSG